MKRLFLPFMMLCLLFVGKVQAQKALNYTPRADGEVVDVMIGDSTATTVDSYLPTYSLYDYSFTQQIYTADEIGYGGTINSLTMWLKNNSSYARNLNVYMKETGDASFADGSAWVSMTDGDMVASFTLDNGITDPVATKVILSTPFEYSGSGNLVLCIQDVTGEWSSGAGGVVMETSVNQAIYHYRDNYVYDPTTPGVNGYTMAKKDIVKLNITPNGGDTPDIPDEYFYISASGWAMWDAAPESYPEEPTCVIDEIEITGFTVPEDGEENDIDLVAGDDNYTIITAEWYEYNSLDPMSEGEIFTAGYTYYMVIQVAIDDECTLDSDYTITINGGTDIIDPDYTDYEDGVLTIVTVDYEIDENPSPSIFPIDFEDGTLGDLIVIDNDNDGNAWTIYNDNTYPNSGSYCARVKYNSSGNDDYLIFPVTPESGDVLNFYAASWSGTWLESFDVRVSTTTPTVAAFTTVLGSYTNVANYAGGYTEYNFDLSSYAGQNIYVAIRCCSVDKYYLLVDDIDIVNAKKAVLASNSNKQAVAHNGKKHEVMKAIKANSRIEFIAPNFWGAKGNRDGEDMFVSYNLYLDGNLVAEGITDLDYYMQEAENFTDGSSHIAKIEAVYESGATLDMTKAWTFQSGDHFTGAPEGLAVNVEGTTANLSWELPEAGLGVTDLFYDFEDGSLGDLTSLNANNDNKYWLATLQYSNYTYEGSGMAMVSYAAPNDDYLITPQIRPTEGSVFSFYANNDGGSTYPETFEVMVSTTGMEAADFTPITDMITISGGYQLFEYGLGDYAGQDIYLAIHNVSDDMDVMFVDNMSITSVEVEMNHVGAVVYRDGEIVAKLRNGETSYTEELEGSDIPTYCISIIQNGSKDAGVYYALAEKQCVEQVVVACQAPYDLAAVADGSDVTLTWNMDGEKSVLLFDDFEDGALTNWTTIDADGDGETWENATPASYGIGDAYSGTNCASSWSWNSYTLYPDNYMISPLVEGATSLHYYVATNSAYPDHYGVYASTTGIDTTDFVLLLEETAGNSKGGVEGAVRSSKTQTGTRAMSSWIEKTITLPAGTKYVAFRHWNSDDMNYLFIDDVTIYGEDIPSTATYNIYSSTDGENYTILAAGVEGTTYTDEDLEPGTYYYQVTANNVVATGDCESEPALAENGDDNFVMVEIEVAEPCVAPISLAAEVNGDDNSVTVTWEMPGQGGEGDFTYTFDTDLQGWINIDANNDGRLWFHSSQHPDYDYSGLDAEGGDGFLVSASYEDGTESSFQANNYIYAPYRYTIASGSQFKFYYDYANDDYPDYFAVVVSTVDNPTSANDFVEIWTVDAKNATSNKAAKRHAQGTRYQNWQQVTVDLSEYAGQQIWIGFHHSDYDEYEVWIDNVEITNATKDGGDVTFNIYRSEDGVDYELIAEGVTDLSFVDTDLEEGTYYYQVTAINTLSDGTTCESEFALAVNGEDDYVMVEIVEPQPIECPAPINLAATLDGNDVTVTWSMPSAGGGKSVLLFDDFEDGALANWTTIDADGDGDSWVNATPASYGIGNAYSGTNCASSWSWNNASYDPDNYLVSPLVEGATKVTYFVATNTAYPDHYGVYASTTGTNASDFTLLFEETAGSKGAQGGVKSSMTQPGDRALSAWMEKTVTLPAGTKYVAFRHYDSYDMNYLFIDDVTIYAEEAPEGVTFNVYRSTDGENYEIVAEGISDMSYFDEDLEAGTYYYQVTAINTLSDGTTCESEFALAVNGEDDYVMVEIEEPQECVAPIDLLATVEDGNVVLVWDMNADVIINGFRIYRSTDGENYEEIATVTETTYTDEGLGDGTYYYQVTALNALAGGECESEPAMDVNNQYNYVEIVLEGIADINNLISVYPNPTKGNVNIEAEGLSNIVVFNALGQVVYEVNATDDHVVVNMSNFGAGVYMFNIITNNGTTVKRVTVAK